jgi:hypothetical protein
VKQELVFKERRVPRVRKVFKVLKQQVVVADLLFKTQLHQPHLALVKPGLIAVLVTPMYTTMTAQVSSGYRLLVELGLLEFKVFKALKVRRAQHLVLVKQSL